LQRPRRRSLLAWLKEETERRGIEPSDLLEEVRAEVRRVGLGKAEG